MNNQSDRQSPVPSEPQHANCAPARETVARNGETRSTYQLDTIIGVSSAMKQAIRVVEKTIESAATVLIGGETGTGKEIVARAIHYNGPRRAGKFIAQNCGSVPEALLESELFGHVRGAFTGAFKDRPGLFQAAHRGTMFLDEIGDMPPSMQVKLLRVLEEGEIRRVGGSDSIPVDVRIISATHKNLRAEVEAGRFRRDLYYRLDVLRIQLPPLRERDGDITLLVRHFFEKYNSRSGKRLRGLSPAALHALSQYSFPGNVRELENEIERAVALANPETLIDVDLLSSDVAGERDTLDPTGSNGSLRHRLRTIERRLILQELGRNNGNRTHSAAKLGISVRGLQKKIVLLGLKDS